MKFYPSRTITGKFKQDQFIIVGDNGYISIIKQNTAYVTKVGSHEWTDVISANGKYIAVSFNGYSTTSTDGLNWTSPVNIGFLGIKGVAYNNGVLVVCGIGGKVAFSTDNAITWTVITVGKSYDDWRQGVTFGNGKFLISNKGRIAYSNDGMTWAGPVSVIINSNNEYWKTKVFTRVIYDGEKFCGIDGTSFFTSNDGLIWNTPILTHASQQLFNITYGNGIYVAVGYTGDVTVSHDGNTWEAKQIGSYSFRGVTYGNGKYIAVGANGYYIISKDNCNTWLRVALKDESGKTINSNLNGVYIIQ